jgi:hypothetical protein
MARSNSENRGGVSLGALLSGGASLICIILGGLALTSLAPDPVDRPLAETYLRQYYDRATRNPATCCYEQLDATFLKLNPSVTHQNYVAFFEGFSAIDVSHVRPGGNGYFTARITYHRKDGTTATEVDRFQLKCSRSTEWPWKNCGEGDITIYDVTNKFR